MQNPKRMHKQTVEIREAQTADARALNRYMQTVFATAHHLITRPTEYRRGFFKQRLWISKKRVNPVEICLIAVSNGEIIGMLDSWTDRRRRISHVTAFGMSVAESHQNQGVGRALLAHFIDWVKAHSSLTRIELHVHGDNLAAIGLYKASGFELEGIRKSAVHYEDGRKVDDHIMALWP